MLPIMFMINTHILFATHNGKKYGFEVLEIENIPEIMDFPAYKRMRLRKIVSFPEKSGDFWYMLLA